MEVILIGNNHFTFFYTSKHDSCIWARERVFCWGGGGVAVANRDVLLMLCLRRIYLMGQSAGAHIAACTLVEQAINEAGEGESTSWSVSQIKAYFGLSGGWVSIAGFFEPCGTLSCVSSTVIQVDASC